MNDKNNESNNMFLSFGDKLKLFDQPSKNDNKFKNEKKSDIPEKKRLANKYQNIQQIISKNIIDKKENLKIESKNKRNIIQENEQNCKINNISIEKKPQTKEDINNYKDKTIKEKNPFKEGTSQQKLKEEKLINKNNKFQKSLKNNNETIENKFKKDLITNKRNNTEYFNNLKENILSLKKEADFSNNRLETICDLKDNIVNSKNDNKVDENKVDLKDSDKINDDTNKRNIKRNSIVPLYNRPLIKNENLINKTPKERIKDHKIKTTLSKFNQIQKNSNQKQVNPISNEIEKNNDEIKNIKVNSYNKSDLESQSEENQIKKIRSNITLVKTNNYNKIQDIILEGEPTNSDIKTNTFCKAFIVASIPKTEIKLIENSEGQKSCCEHEECSLFPSIEPKIIYKYPEKDTKELEITNVLSYLSFPENIKICITEDESKIIPIKDYKTCITNQVGDRYYLVTYHFHTKISIKDFFENYQGDIDTIKQKIKNIKNKKNITDIYIPYCISLISKYSFFSQIEACLQSIFLYLTEQNIKYENLKEFLTYLIQSVPAPYINTSIYFPIPNCTYLIELYPPFYQDLEVFSTTPITLLDQIKRDNIIILVRLLLLEQKILLISNNYNYLTKTSLYLISLLYPFSWTNIYIPIITSNFLKYLESFLPFLIGMNKSLYEKEEVKNIIHKSQKNLYIFDIDEDKFEISKNILTEHKTDYIKYLNNHVSSFPKKIEESIKEQLKILELYYKDSVDKKSDFDENKRQKMISNCIKIKEIFIQAFIELFHDYKKYLSIIGDIPIFNTKAFIEDKTKEEQKFYKEFTSTQIFQIFIQNSVSYMNKKSKKYYFDELIEDYLNKKKEILKKNQKNYFIILNSELEKKMEKNLYRTSKIYYIKPSNLKLFQKINNIIKDKNGIEYLEQLKFNLQKDFKYKDLLTKEGKLKNSKKIINHELKILDKKIENTKSTKKIEKYIYFMTEEEIKEMEELTTEKNFKNKKVNEEEINKKDNIYNDNNDKNNIQKELSEVEKESIKDNIDAKLRKIFRMEKADKKKDSDSNVLITSLETDFGKNYFLSLFILHNKRKQDIFINEDSFQILFDVVIKSLQNYTKTNPDEIVYPFKLLNSFIYFKKVKDKQEVSLAENMTEYLINKKYNIMNNKEFWELWIVNELKEINKDLFERLSSIYETQEKEFVFIDNEDKEVIEYREKAKILIEELKNKLIRFKMNTDIILTIVEYLCDKFIHLDQIKTQIVSEIMGRSFGVSKKK